jgi:hypothetical protein
MVSQCRIKKVCPMPPKLCYEFNLRKGHSGCSRYALKYVPEKLKTLKFCQAALESNNKALQFVPKIFR